MTSSTDSDNEEPIAWSNLTTNRKFDGDYLIKLRKNDIIFIISQF